MDGRLAERLGDVELYDGRESEDSKIPEIHKKNDDIGSSLSRMIQRGTKANRTRTRRTG